MAIYITAIRVGSPPANERITDVMWLSGTTGKAGPTTVASMVKHIDKHDNVKVGGSDGPVDVIVVRPDGGPAHLRTEKNGTPTDNLLQLPTF